MKSRSSAERPILPRSQATAKGPAPHRDVISSVARSSRSPAHASEATRAARAKRFDWPAMKTAQNRDSLPDAMLRAFMAGIPSREHKRMFKGASGTSPGEVSRLWEREDLRCIEQLRERNLGKEDYVGLMLDGIGSCIEAWQ